MGTWVVMAYLPYLVIAGAASGLSPACAPSFSSDGWTRSPRPDRCKIKSRGICRGIQTVEKEKSHFFKWGCKKFSPRFLAKLSEKNFVRGVISEAHVLENDGIRYYFRRLRTTELLAGGLFRQTAQPPASLVVVFIFFGKITRFVPDTTGWPRLLRRGRCPPPHTGRPPSRGNWALPMAMGVPTTSSMDRSLGLSPTAAHRFQGHPL